MYCTGWLLILKSCSLSTDAAGLMAANLVGFVVGIDGLKPLLADMAARPAFAAATLAVFFSAAQVCLGGLAGTKLLLMSCHQACFQTQILAGK